MTDLSSFDGGEKSDSDSWFQSYSDGPKIEEEDTQDEFDSILDGLDFFRALKDE